MKHMPFDRPPAFRPHTATTYAVPLGSEREAIIDRVDAPLLSGFYWRELTPKRANTTYAHAWQNRMHIYMHRLVIGAGPKDEVDHINRNGLDNRRLNLRFASHAHNSANKVKPRTAHTLTSRYKGVFWDSSKRKWMVTISLDNKTKYVGRYHDEEDAARAYDQAALTAWGEFARLNFPT